VINYKLTYFKKGKELQKLIPIRFVSNRVYDWYSDIMERENKIRTLHADKRRAIENQAVLIIEKDKTILQKIKDGKALRDEVKNIDKEIKATDSKDFVQARFKLIERILSDNAIDDPDLLDPEFWNDCLEPMELWGFITAAVTKDSQGQSKKKVK